MFDEVLNAPLNAIVLNLMKEVLAEAILKIGNTAGISESK